MGRRHDFPVTRDAVTATEGKSGARTDPPRRLVGALRDR